MNLFNQSEPARRGSYMGDSDGAVHQWSSVFAARIEAQPEAFGLTVDDAAAIRAVVDAYSAAYAKVVSPTLNSTAAAIAKNEKRAELERMCRPFAMQIKANPHVSNELKFSAGLRLDDAHRTPVGVPRTRPVLSVREMDWTGFVLRFRDSGMEESRAKPKGVTALLLCADFATPGSANGFEEGQRSVHFVALLTRSPQRVAFPPEVLDGRAARYHGCWVNTKGKLGPWSSPLTLPGTGAVGGGVMDAQGTRTPGGDALKLAG